jgi:hypothetical protein
MQAYLSQSASALNFRISYYTTRSKTTIAAIVITIINADDKLDVMIKRVAMLLRIFTGVCDYRRGMDWITYLRS